MNIEETTENLKKYISFSKKECNFPSIWDWNWHMDLANDVKTLLTAYEKEKGENVKLRLQDIPLIEGELKAYKDRVNELKQELEKEKEKNKELSNSYDKLAKECNEENRRCMLLAVENQQLKEKNKKLNISRLELIISQLPDTTETYKKYKKELDELLKEE